MFCAENYLSRLTTLLQKAYGERLLYIGLQGSYLRDEATNHSDIDIMTVIDDITPKDLQTYRQAILQLENPELSCGFICGKEDLLCWNPLEICHLLHSTKDYYGILSELVPSYSKTDVVNFIKFSVNNLYHEICHRRIHSSEEKNRQKLAGTYRGVFFILQNLYFLQTGKFPATKTELASLLQGNDKLILERCMAYSKGEDFDFDESFSLLFYWCKETLAKTDKLL